jgi:hypothetical protein
MASDGANNGINLGGDQVVIDVTAQANDILKRVQGVVALREASTLDYPQYALQSMDTICKRIRVQKIGSGNNAADFGQTRIDDDLTDTDVQRACQHSGF